MRSSPTADSETLSGAELHEVLTARLSAARGGLGTAPGPASDRELFRRMPGAALDRIVGVEIDEISRRTDDLLFPIESGGGPLTRVRAAIKRAVRRLGLHYLIRQTEMNERLARAVAALQSFLDRSLAEIERADGEQLGRITELAAHLDALAQVSARASASIEEREERDAALTERIARATTDLDATRHQVTEVVERVGAVEQRLPDELAKRDEWLRSLESQLRAVLEDVRDQIRERDAWIDSTRRTVEDALTELRQFASARDEWLRNLESSFRAHRTDLERQSEHRDAWLTRIESSLGDLRRETEHGLQSRDQWLRALETSIHQVTACVGGSTPFPAGGAIPEDTWIVATRTHAAALTSSLGTHQTAAALAAPADASRIESIRALLTDVAELRPREKVVAELEPFRRRLADRRKVVDVGCGEGHALAFLRELGVTAEGVDLDEHAVAACRAEGFAAVHADAIDYLASPARGADVDAIVCLHLIEHLDVNPALELLIAFATALPPGGLLILATPNPESLSTQLVHFWRDLGHVRPYPRITLERILGKLGFAIEALPGAAPAPSRG